MVSHGNKIRLLLGTHSRKTFVYRNVKRVGPDGAEVEADKLGRGGLHHAARNLVVRAKHTRILENRKLTISRFTMILRHCISIFLVATTTCTRRCSACCPGGTRRSLKET